LKHIIFVLPGCEKGPIGGYKVVYEYANRLISDYKVSILYPYFRFNIKKEKISILTRLRGLCTWSIKKIFGLFHPASWFNLDSRIKKIPCLSITKKLLRKYKDAIFVATSLKTAYDLNKIGVTKKNGFYLIQDFEAWFGLSEQQVLDSYKFPLNKIAIAPWLVEKINSVGEEAKLIPNGFDFDYFKLTNPIETRKQYEIAMLNHDDERKRCIDSFEALKIVKETIPELHVNIFGMPDRPKDLPNWYTYYKKPNQEEHNKIYNTAAIFIAASKAEGMALPPAEAMQCGAALCCTDIPGFSLYAKDNETALLSEVYDVKELASNILKLIKDKELRTRIAKTGNKFIQQFTWEKAVKCFKEYIESI